MAVVCAGGQIELTNSVVGARYDLHSMLIEEALAGLGVALVPRLHVGAELEQGCLVAPTKRIGQQAVRSRRSTMCRFSSTIEARLSPTTYRQPRKFLDLMRPGTKQLLAFALISATLVGVKFGIYTRSHVANLLLLLSCLAAYTFIAFFAFALKPPLLGAALGTLLSLPIAASILASPLILLASIWALNDFAAGPDAVIPLANGLLCAEYSSGTAVTEATQTFELNRPVLGLFWVRLAIESGPILEGYPFQEGCASVYEKWRSSVKSST